MVPVEHDNRDLRDSACIDVHSYLKLECLGISWNFRFFERVITLTPPFSDTPNVIKHGILIKYHN